MFMMIMMIIIIMIIIMKGNWGLMILLPWSWFALCMNVSVSFCEYLNFPLRVACWVSEYVRVNIQWALCNLLSGGGGICRLLHDKKHISGKEKDAKPFSFHFVWLRSSATSALPSSPVLNWTLRRWPSCDHHGICGYLAYSHRNSPFTLTNYPG